MKNIDWRLFDSEVFNIAPQLEISKRNSKVGDGAVRKTEGRKEEYHANNPCLSPEFSRGWIRRNGKRWGRPEERSANSRREARKRRTAWTKPLQRLAFVAEANSPSALFVAAPTPCCHYMVVCVRARPCSCEYVRLPIHLGNSCVAAGGRSNLSKRKGCGEMRRYISAGSHLADISLISSYLIYHCSTEVRRTAIQR